MRFKVPRVPQLTHELSEPLHKQEHAVAGGPLHLGVVLLVQEVVSQRRHVGQRL